jgi:hypothetical protein
MTIDTENKRLIEMAEQYARQEIAKGRDADEVFAEIEEIQNRVFAESQAKQRVAREAQETISAAGAQEIAHGLLVQSGETAEAAWRILAMEPDRVRDLAPQIKQRQEQIAAEAKIASDEAFARTPEGRRIEAARAFRERAEHEKLISEARALIESEHGISTEGMPDDEVLHNAGIAPQVALMGLAERDAAAEQLVANWNTLDRGERRARQRELGISDQTISNLTQPETTSQEGEGQ